MPSDRYKKMRGELGRLKRSLIPRAKKGDLIDLTPRLSLRALAYRILCHAEIENYIEDRVQEIALAAQNSWRTRRHVSEATLCLLAFGGTPTINIPKSVKPPSNKKQTDWSALLNPDDRLDRSISGYIRRVKIENHGIKEENLLSLLLPIGFQAANLDEILLADLNDFAAKRGRAAHVSVSGHVSTGVNPIDEAEQVKRIVDGLIALDRELTVILKAAS